MPCKVSIKRPQTFGDSPSIEIKITPAALAVNLLVCSQEFDSTGLKLIKIASMSFLKEINLSNSVGSMVDLAPVSLTSLTERSNVIALGLDPEQLAASRCSHHGREWSLGTGTWAPAFVWSPAWC